MKFHTGIFWKSVEKIQVYYNRARINGTLHEVTCTFITLSGWIILEWYMFETKFLENIETQNLFSKACFWESYHLWDNVENCVTAGGATNGDIIRHMSTACWIPKTTFTHTEYVMFIVFSTATMVTRTILNVRLYVHSEWFWMKASQCAWKSISITQTYVSTIYLF